VISKNLAWVGLVSNDVDAAAAVFATHLGLPRSNLASAEGPVPVFAIGRSALALFPPGHSLVNGESKAGVHHIALEVGDLDAATRAAATVGISATGAPARGLGAARCVMLDRDATVGVRTYLTEPIELARHEAGILERIDHLGVASTDVAQDERVFSNGLGFPVESRQTDMEVTMSVESFTSDKYGVVYHSREPEPVGGLRVCFISVGDADLEFLANFNPRQGAHVEHGVPGNTKQDQGAITRFVGGRGRGLHHIALKAKDIDATLARLEAAGLPMIDTRGRPGSRRALIGFVHPKALGGVLMHIVERP
jgi:catechol 2,3-dioxygenase-like lactoylglutathione lyase family enzyme